MSSPDYIVDIKGLRDRHASGEGKAGKVSLRGRPWLAIHFRCCSVYSRIYRNRAATAYEGRCPKCARPVEVKIGEGGTNNRFFTAD